MSRKSAIKFTTLLGICTDGAPSMIGRTAGQVLRRFWKQNNIVRDFIEDR